MRLSVRTGVTAVALAAALLVGGAAVQRAFEPAAAPAQQQASIVGQVGQVQPVEPPPAAEAVPAPPPGVEVAPEPEVAPPDARPRQSFGRMAGLHRTKDPLHLVSSAAIVVEGKSGRVLYEKNDEAVLPIASLTKLMTAIVITEARLPLDEEITITQDDVDTERNSRSRLRVGTTLTRDEALHLALMSSENRAAHALGRTFPGGLSQFVNAMNNKARQLGMKSTAYVDPTGLSNRNQSTARDLALVAMEAARHKLLREYSTTDRRLVELGGRKLQYLNSNRLVRNPGWDIELQKTGYIIEAGQCVAMQARIGGNDVVMVLLDATDKTSRSRDAERIKRWVTTQAEGRQTTAGPPAAGETLALAKAGPRS